MFLRQLQWVVDELIGRGLPAPSDALRRARFRADRPWCWCPRCGCERHWLPDTREPQGSSAARAPPRRGRKRLACPAAQMAHRPECIVRLGSHHGALRRWIVDIKHGAWEAMAEELGGALGRQLIRCGVVACQDPDAVLVPVPSPWLRAHARGIDHAGAIASSASFVTRVPLCIALSQRLGGTQVDVDDRAARIGRDSHRFTARARARATIAGRHAVLIDDVRTTGATLAAAAQVLRSMGAARVSAGVVSVKE